MLCRFFAEVCSDGLLISTTACINLTIIFHSYVIQISTYFRLNFLASQNIKEETFHSDSSAKSCSDWCLW